MPNNILFRWVMALTIALMLPACASSQGTLVPQPTQPPVPALTATPQPTITSASTRTPTPISFASAAYNGWLKYANAKYKFSLRYPSDWTCREIQGGVNTMSGHAVYLEPRAASLIRLVVGFKRAAEDAQITRTGVGSGEIIQRGSVAFLGQPLSRDVLVLNGNDLTILYRGSGEIRRGDLAFTLSLDYRGNPLDKSALTKESQTTADMIVASFELM